MDPAPGLLDALRGIVGLAHVLTGDQAAGHEQDWTGRWRGRAAAVVRPADTTQVAAVLAACAAHRTAVVPQGGNTGLVGGGVPRGGEVVLSTRRMDQVGPVDAAAATVTVGAGAVLSQVNAAAAPHGLRVGVDLAARDSATIGGMVATNAGGIHVVAHGTMRHQVRGLEAVLADGTVLRRMRGLAKDNAGYDLPQVLAGSEGTLGVLTQVVLRLVPTPSSTTTVMAALTDVGRAVDLLRTAEALGRLHAVEVMTAPGIHLVAEHLQAVPPVTVPDAGAALLLEWLGEVDLTDLIDAGIASGDVASHDLVAAQDDADRRALWRWRESHTEAINAQGPAIKLDLSLPVSATMAFTDAVRDAVRDAGLPPPVVFGHLAEGTLHVNLPGAGGSGQAPDAVTDEIEDRLLRLCAAHGGSIAAEHGVGIAKAPWLHLTRSEAEIAIMRRIKEALDPQGILNPGVIL